MEQIKLAENLSRFRRERGMTQEQLAEKCNVSRQAVAKWESGAALPDIYKLVELSEHLDVTTDELLFESPNRKDILTIGASMAEQLRDMAKTSEMYRNLVENIVNIEGKMVQVGEAISKSVVSLHEKVDLKRQEESEEAGLEPDFTFDQDPDFRDAMALARLAKEIEPKSAELACYVYEQAAIRGSIWAGFDALRLFRKILDECIICEEYEEVDCIISELIGLFHTLSKNLKKIQEEAEIEEGQKVFLYYKFLGDDLYIDYYEEMEEEIDKLPHISLKEKYGSWLKKGGEVKEEGKEEASEKNEEEGEEKEREKEVEETESPIG